jgi:hypothetical protein
MMAGAGVTSVHDAQGSPDDLRAYQDAHEAGDLSVRVYCFIDSPHFDQMLAAGVRTGLGNEWVPRVALKLTCDGSISERRRAFRTLHRAAQRPRHSVGEEPEQYALRSESARSRLAGRGPRNGDVAIDQTCASTNACKGTPRRDPRFRRSTARINDSLCSESVWGRFPTLQLTFTSRRKDA